MAFFTPNNRKGQNGNWYGACLLYYAVFVITPKCCFGRTETLTRNKSFANLIFWESMRKYPVVCPQTPLNFVLSWKLENGIRLEIIDDIIESPALGIQGKVNLAFYILLNLPGCLVKNIQDEEGFFYSVLRTIQNIWKIFTNVYKRCYM